MILKRENFFVSPATESHRCKRGVSVDVSVADDFSCVKGETGCVDAKILSELKMDELANAHASFAGKMPALPEGSRLGVVFRLVLGWGRATGIFAQGFFGKLGLSRAGEEVGGVGFDAARFKPFWRVWIRRYALAFVITAGLHAALFLAPSGKSPGGGGAGAKSAGAEEGAFVLIDSAGVSSQSVAARAQASDAGAAAGGGVASVFSRDEVAGVAADMISWELAVLRADSFVWGAAGERLGPAGAGSGFDALGALRGAAGGGVGSGFGEGFFSVARVSGAGGRLGFGARGVSATFMPEPVYPESARRERREGVVELDVVVDVLGRASAVGIAKSSGHADLDAVARSTVLRQWRFARSTADDARYCVVLIAFNLRRG